METQNRLPRDGKKKPETPMTNTSANDSCNKQNTGTERSGKWSLGDLETLMAMVKKGIAVAEIARALNRKAESVKAQMSCLKVKSKIRGNSSGQARLPREPNALAKDMLNLKKNHCRWPCAGDVFCKVETEIGKPYCAEHEKKALSEWVKPLNIKGLVDLGR